MFSVTFFTEARQSGEFSEYDLTYEYKQEICSLIIGPHTYADTPWKQKEMIIADAEQLLQVVLLVAELP